MRNNGPCFEKVKFEKDFFDVAPTMHTFRLCDAGVTKGAKSTWEGAAIIYGRQSEIAIEPLVRLCSRVVAAYKVPRSVQVNMERQGE